MALEAPERCSLAQALLWLSRGQMPIRDSEFEATPEELTGTDYKQRNRLIRAIRAGELGPKGDITFYRALYSASGLYRVGKERLFKGMKFNYNPNGYYFHSLTSNIEYSRINIYGSEMFRDELLDRSLSFISDNYGIESHDIIAEVTSITVETKLLFTFFSDVSNLIPEVSDANFANVLSSRGSNRGAPVKYNWDQLWAELAVRADLDGLPATQAECLNAISEWCVSRWGEAPIV